MNKTKIVATIGPSNCSYEKLKELVKAGMSVARLNLKHADYDFCTEVVENINKLNDEFVLFIFLFLFWIRCFYSCFKFPLKRSPVA